MSYTFSLRIIHNFVWNCACDVLVRKKTVVCFTKLWPEERHTLVREVWKFHRSYHSEEFKDPFTGNVNLSLQFLSIPSSRVKCYSVCVWS